MNLSNPISLSVAFFLAGYLLNIFYVTVLYHRGLTHQAVQLSRFSLFLLRYTGNWVTGLDPKAWACMHRLHHQHSDTESDPHSPRYNGVFGTGPAQLKAYQKILAKLTLGDRKTSRVVADIPFDVCFLNRKKLWYLPYFVHIAIGVAIGFYFQSALCGAAYTIGILSHPFQGWLVNAFAHTFGYTNFQTQDRSKNNFLVSFFVFGEGYQNNHHAFPKNANFGHHFYELDPGYGLCIVASWLGMLSFPKKTAEATTA